jgi:hypothetical protein
VSGLNEQFAKLSIERSEGSNPSASATTILRKVASMQTLEVGVQDQIVNDIFEGLSDLELMNKYRVTSVADLFAIFARLVMLGIVEEEEIHRRFPIFKQTVKNNSVDNAPLEAREAPRNSLFGRVEICDITKGSCSYGLEIKDISISGIMVAPMKVAKGQEHHFLIKPTHLEDVGIIEFTAECRWTDGLRAGFKITDMSPSNTKELKKFIQLFSYESL